MDKEIRVYLSARVSPDAQDWNEYVCSFLKPPIKVFLPHKYVPDCKHEDMPLKVYLQDMSEIKKSHACLLLPEFGNDCSCEIGWYAQSKKPVVCFVDDQTKWLNNIQKVKLGIDVVVTTNKTTYGLLQKDDILKDAKLLLIRDISELNDVIKEYKTYPKLAALEKKRVRTH